MNRGFLLISIFLAFSCLSVHADEPGKAKEEMLNKWKSAIVSRIRNQVSDAGFRSSKGSWTVCTVSFKINGDGTILEFHTDSRSNGLFSALVKTQVESLKGSSLVKFPENFPDDAVKFEFEVTSDGRVPIDEESKRQEEPKTGLTNAVQSEPVSTAPMTWERWDQRIINAIDYRVQSACQARAHLKLYPLFCKVSFDITRAGEIRLIRSTDSGVIMFDSAIYDAIKWLKGSDLLTFPAGSQESHRTVTAEFSNFPGSSDHTDSALKEFLDGKRQQYNGFDARGRSHDK